jgi:hypothetical protein
MTRNLERRGLNPLRAWRFFTELGARTTPGVVGLLPESTFLSVVNVARTLPEIYIRIQVRSGSRAAFDGHLRERAAERDDSPQAWRALVAPMRQAVKVDRSTIDNARVAIPSPRTCLDEEGKRGGIRRPIRYDKSRIVVSAAQIAGIREGRELGGEGAKD